MAAISRYSSVDQINQGRDFSCSSLKKRRLESEANESSATEISTSAAAKKRCVIQDTDKTSSPTVDTTIEDAFRKKFLESLCVQWLSMRAESLSKSAVYVISSDLQNQSEKDVSMRHAIEQSKRIFPDHALKMRWVKIPKDEFFTSCHFQKMVEAIHNIPFHSIICFQTGNAFIAPTCSPDKVIFYESEQLSPNLQMICKIYQAICPQIPHYYVNESCPKPKLTGRSICYIYENERLMRQRPEDLILKGFYCK